MTKRQLNITAIREKKYIWKYQGGIHQLAQRHQYGQQKDEDQLPQDLAVLYDLYMVVGGEKLLDFSVWKE